MATITVQIDEDQFITYRARPAGDIVLDMFNCFTRVAYLVAFFGANAEAQALAYLDGKGMTHASCEFVDNYNPMEEQPLLDPAKYPLLFDKFYPTCEHGMDGRNCMGPEHFMSAEQERQMGW